MSDLRSPFASPRPAVPVRLIPRLQHYAWGDPDFIPGVLGLDPDGRPVAEAWYGDHLMAPATAVTDDGELPLGALIGQDPGAYLGSDLAARSRGLPVLLKLLAASEPLSIQVHPDREQAEAGFDREEASGRARDAVHRSFRDRNPKPEVIVAMTPFHALVGFRPYHEIATALDALPEVRGLLPPFEPDREGLRGLLDAYYSLPEVRLTDALLALVRRLEDEDAADPSGPDTPRYWALRAHRALGTEAPDRGLVFVFLMNLVHLQPGEAMYTPPGVLHAYLEGAGVELMASSDNVIRVGLTPKHVDVAEVLRVARIDPGAPQVLHAVELDDGVTRRYPLPAAELDLAMITVDAEVTVPVHADGPLLLLALPDDRDTEVHVDHGAGRVTLPRGSAALVPAGVEVRIGASGSATVVRVQVPAADPDPAFRGRRPACLRFGTSGLRGRVEEITDLEAYVNTRGFLDFLLAEGDVGPGMPIAVAGDLRPSTDSVDRSILRAVARAIVDAGFEVVNAGRIPTPALTLHGIEHGIASVMVTGSHIPFDRNGIKFNRTTGEVRKSDEAGILAAVARVREREYRRTSGTSPFDDDGWLRSGESVTLPPVDDTAREAYVRRYLDAFPDGALAGLRLVLFEHSAVGRELVAGILRGLGAEVHPRGRAETFVAIDTEAISPDRLAELQTLLDDARAELGPIDAVVSTDGDSDRPLLMGVDADGRGHFVPGDVLGTLVAAALGADAVAVPVSSTDLIDRHLAPLGVELVRTRIGSPWVIAAMDELRGQRRVGWEANGGFLTGSTLELEDRPLAPLPTRDAVLPIVTALHAARRANGSVVDLVAGLPARFSRSGLLDEVPMETSRAILGLLGPGDADATDRIERHFGADRGFGSLGDVNVLDGVRMHFSNGDVAHVRPSGNAPQLRIYAVADTARRADEIVAMALAEPDGILRSLAREAGEHRFVSAVARNVATASALLSGGESAAIVGTVSGSEAARAFWQRHLDLARESFGAREACSFHEDLPVNQAFGLLLLWQRLRPHLRDGEGALIAFVFGEGSRATPFTEAECGQKPALRSFVVTGSGEARRPLSIVELALRTFAPVEAYLRRSGFDGMVVKWGDEVQIPALDLSGYDPRLDGADVVRFVSLRPMTEETAREKDWVGVDAEGRVTAFIPRRPLAEMAPLADRGLLQRDGDELVGGINLGSIAMSRALLDLLLEEFEAEVLDPAADRKRRPDLDPQLFTALTIAAIPDGAERDDAWRTAIGESPAIATLASNLPDVLGRLRGVLDRFETRHGRPVRMRALDFGDQYWGDVGQHRQMYDLYMALRDPGPDGRIARALAGIVETRDSDGNLVAGTTVLGPGVRARNSVLIDVDIDEGEIEGSVLVGTRCGRLIARDAFDVGSVATELSLAPRAGAYRIVSADPVSLAEGERATTVFLPTGEVLLRVDEDTDLRDRGATYDVPLPGNPLSFRDAHEQVIAADPAELEARRERRIAEVDATRQR